MQNVLIPVWVKKTIAAIGFYVISFIAPLKWYLIAVGLLTMCDLYTGIRAGKKRGEKIKSFGLRRSVDKIVLYFIAILLSELMMRAFFQSMLPDGTPTSISITFVTASFIALVELKSNLENISEVTGLDIWKKLIDIMPSLGNKSRKSDN